MTIVALDSQNDACITVLSRFIVMAPLGVWEIKLEQNRIE
jgi:hypothetical protein